MRVLLASPLGFLVGVSLGALGGGGSILAVPMLVYGAGQTAHAATSTSLLLVGTAALVALATHWRAGRVRVGTGVAFGVVGIAGSIAGSALNRRLDPDLLLLGFSGLVLLAAWRMRVGCPTCTAVGADEALSVPAARPDRGAIALDANARLSVAVRVLLAGTAVGFLTGLFGVGGGFVIVPAVALLMRLPMPQAIGTSLVVIAINSAVALSSRVATASVDWAVAIPFTAAAVAGALAGGRVAGRIDAERSLRWFSALLVAVAVYTAARSALAVAS